MWLERSRPAVKGGHSDRAVLRALALLVAGFGSACFKLDDDDCALSSTCPGQPIAHYAADRGHHCAACLRRECSTEAAACDGTQFCRSAVECALQSNPGAVQRCYAKVLTAEPEAGAAQAPWDATKDFEECIDRACAMDCERHISDWSCLEGAGYDLPNDGRLDAVLYVSFFGAFGARFTPANDVNVSYCYGDPKKNCSEAGRTNAAGVLELPEDVRTSGGMYFKLEDRAVDPERFPTTLVYPRPIERSATQPIAIYLITRSLVGLSNDKLLGTDAGVLADRAQSIILTDACRPQETVSAPHLTIQVRGIPMLSICSANGQSECLWYGDDDFLPDLEQTVSIGTSSGVLGLSEREYEIQACTDGALVARRSVWMVPGWLTFARLWPLTNSDRDRLGDDLTDCAKIDAHATD